MKFSEFFSVERVFKTLETLEPDDVYEQCKLPFNRRSFRMQLSDAFYFIFKRWL